LLQPVSFRNQARRPCKFWQLFVLETRDALDSDPTFDSTAQDVVAVNLNLVHPLTGPIYILLNERKPCRNESPHCCQVSEKLGGRTRARTSDPLIKSLVLHK